MKKLILVFVAIAITAGVYAQTNPTNKKVDSREMNQQNQNQNQNLQNNPTDQSRTDGIIMQNGKMMQMKNGQATSLDQEITLSNGTKVMSDGTYINKDGSKMKWKEGQHMDMSGKMVTNKDKNQSIVPDTTKNKNN